jgi:hypothetical protein
MKQTGTAATATATATACEHDRRSKLLDSTVNKIARTGAEVLTPRRYGACHCRSVPHTSQEGALKLLNV